MIGRNGNDPAVVSRGPTNEIGGQNPPAYQFVKQMLAEAKRLDPNRLCAYASNSLGETPERDVAGALRLIGEKEGLSNRGAGKSTSLAPVLFKFPPPPSGQSRIRPEKGLL